MWLIVGIGFSEPSIWSDANASKSNEIVSTNSCVDRGNMLLQFYFNLCFVCVSECVCLLGVYSRTTNVAIPWPVLAHMLVTPNFPPVSPKCARIVAINRPPVAPSGSTHPSDPNFKGVNTSKCDRPTIRIHFLWIQPNFLNTIHRLRRKRSPSQLPT